MLGNVPLSMQDGMVKYLADVLHVPQITKNLVSLCQMIEQGLQVRFNPDGLFLSKSSTISASWLQKVRDQKGCLLWM